MSTSTKSRKSFWSQAYTRDNAHLLVAAIALSVVAVLFSGALMFTSGYMISLAATVPFTVLALHLPSIFVRIFGIGKPLIQYVDRLISHDWVLRVTSKLRKRIYLLVERSKISSLGGALSVFADDVEHIQNLYLRCFIPVASLFLLYVIVLLLTGLFSPALAILLFICMGAICIALPLWVHVLCAPKILEIEQLNKRAYELSVERAVNILDWKLSGRVDDFSNAPLGIFSKIDELNFKNKRTLHVLSLVRELICVLCICAIFAWASIALGNISAFEGKPLDGFFSTDLVSQLGNVIMHDSVAWSLNWVAAFVLCAFPILEAFTSANEAILGYAKHKAAISNLSSLENKTDENLEISNEKNCEYAKDCNENFNAMFKNPNSISCDTNNAIELKNVNFTYAEEEHPILLNYDLAIPRGSHVAIIGKSGVGKTTLLDIIRGRIVPESGQVSVRGEIGMVEQAPYVFNTSLRENLYLANPCAEDDELLAVLKLVKLDEFTANLEGGLDAYIAEDGIDISGGERQRLALARIYLYGCDIVLLDEPFQGLDELTAREICRTMHEAFADKTLVVVTHDVDYLNDFDNVIEFCV